MCLVVNMQCRFTDYTVPYIKHSDTHKQTAHLITLQLARSFTALLVACANCTTSYPNRQCGFVRFSNKYALDVSGLWEDRCVWVCICVSSLSLTLSAVDFSLVVPPPTGYTNSLSLIHLSSFPLPTSATLLLFIFFLSYQIPALFPSCLHHRLFWEQLQGLHNPLPLSHKHIDVLSFPLALFIFFWKYQFFLIEYASFFIWSETYLFEERQFLIIFL